MLGTLSCMTGGDTFLYSNFIAQRDAIRLAGDFTRTITRETGYQAMMKVRCANGLRVADYDGNFFQHKPTEIEFGTIDGDKGIVVKFKHDGKLDRKLDVLFQSALLYTTAAGERRVRVQNIAGLSTNDVSEVFKHADEDAITVAIAKEASFKMLTKTSREVRDGIGDKCIRILANYRKYSASGAHQGQLILPEKLTLLPLYTLSLLKSRAFRGKPACDGTDYRWQSIQRYESLQYAANTRIGSDGLDRLPVPADIFTAYHDRNCPTLCHSGN